jgi:hypothetical protein
MADFKTWMRWGPNKVSPEDVIEALKGSGVTRHAVCKSFKTDWGKSLKKFEEGKIKPEIFSKEVGKYFWKYYFVLGFSSMRQGLPTVSPVAFKQKKLEFVKMSFNTENLTSLIAEYDKSSASSFQGAATNTGKRGPLTDGPKTKLANSVPLLEHRILTGKERLWWAPSTKAIYTTSGHLDTSKPGKKVHENLVIQVNKLGTASTDVAYCTLNEFNGQLFMVA